MVHEAPFRFLMLSAMYENGGNTTHRLLDGHPQLYVYPFESQVGTRYVADYLTSLFPVKYRWPQFQLTSTPEADYRAIIDEEGKVRARTPHVSKFRDRPFDLNDDERMAIFCRHLARGERTRGRLVEAFFRATFEAWKDHKRSGEEQVYVGYSPIIGVDADKISNDLPHGHVLHVVRNPYSAYADTKKRPVPLSLDHYLFGWCTTQYFAKLYESQYPDRMHVLRYEDIVANPVKVLGGLCGKLGLRASDTLAHPSWNAAPLEQVYPWGTIRTPTPAANRATAAELSPAEQAAITLRAGPYLKLFGYEQFLT